MKKDRRWIWLLVGIVVAVLALKVGLDWWNRDVVKIKTAAVVKGPIEAVVSASGLVDAPVYELGPKMGGRIQTLDVKEGDRVRSGATLVTFDDTTRLVAPASGIVAKVNYDAGETVVPGTTVVTIVNYNKSWVEAQIDEIDIAGVAIGDKVKITTDVYPDKVFDGEIYWLAPLAELRRVGGRVKLDEEAYVFPCKIRFLGRHDELKVNMTVNVDVVTKKNNQALIVPREALISRDDSTYVFILKKDRVYETAISVGIRSYSSVEAVAGIAEGDVLAIANVAKLKNKGKIKIEQANGR